MLGFHPVSPPVPDVTHHAVPLFGSQFKGRKTSAVGHHVERHRLVQVCVTCHNKVNGLARSRLVGLQNQNVKHCVTCTENRKSKIRVGRKTSKI